jgi:sulfite exporter TauE/SafE
MITNVGTIDRILRVIAGVALIAFALGYIFPATGWNWIGWIGAVPILSAVLGTCPAYSIMGLSTCPAKPA